MNPLDMLDPAGQREPIAEPLTPIPQGIMDARDQPAPSPWLNDSEQLGDDPIQRRSRHDAAILRPLATRHGAVRVIRAQTLTLAAGDPVRLLGLEPGIAQAQNIAYLVLMVAPGAGVLQIAGTESALPGERATIPTGTAAADGPTPPFTLHGVAGVYAWASGAPVTVSVLIVGEASN